MNLPSSGDQGEDDNLTWVDETLKMRDIDAVPSRLYKFVSPDSKYFPLAMHELFLHSRIYLSCRKDFNDPFDSVIALDVPDSPEAIEAFEAGFAARNPDSDISGFSDERLKDPEGWRARAQAGMETSMDSVGIYSLADSVKHPLMWVHYAAAHRGIALIFRHGLEDTFGAFPIRYQNDYPHSNVGAKGIDVYQSLIKGTSWAYEGEWRIAEARSACQWSDLPPSVLCGVVFGARASVETIEFVLDLIKRRVVSGLSPMQVYRTGIGESFGLEFFKLGVGQWDPAALT